MSVLSILDICAAVLIIIHMLLLRWKLPSGWLVGIGSSSVYGIMAVMLGLPCLAGLEIFLISTFILNYKKWKKDEYINGCDEICRICRHVTEDPEIAPCATCSDKRHFEWRGGKIEKSINRPQEETAA